MSAIIEHVELFDLDLPLRSPYRTAVGDIDRYRTLLVRMRAGEREGVGECTPVPGYSWETASSAWQFAIEQGGRAAGSGAAELVNAMGPLAAEHPFATAAFVSAAEQLLDDSPLAARATARVPLVGILNVAEAQAIPAEVERLIERGYETIKVKVGFDVDDDIARVRAAQRQAKGRASLRIDANQGFSEEAARRFVRAVEPEGIELFEQPFPAGEWELMERLARNCPLPLMLDESIASLADIEEAARRRCARLVKLKLMKSGGAAALGEGIARARELGLGIVVGNGVATDVGCLHEAIVCANLGVASAGEMNGFLKVKGGFLRWPPRAEAAGIVVTPGRPPPLDVERARSYAIAYRSWSA